MIKYFGLSMGNYLPRMLKIQTWTLQNVKLLVYGSPYSNISRSPKHKPELYFKNHKPSFWAAMINHWQSGDQSLLRVDRSLSAKNPFWAIFTSHPLNFTKIYSYYEVLRS